jgi:hypothetical protein
VTPAVIGNQILIGFVVGILVGLTGVGGGILLLPIFTSVLGIPAIVAVGSDALVNCVTKVGAGIVHWRRGNINWRLIAALLSGSVPGAVLGVFFLSVLHARHGEGVNHFLKVMIAALLIVIPVISLLIRRSSPSPVPTQLKRGKQLYGIAVIGFIVGLLVGITSIGSGTVTLMLLLVFYGFAPAILVGTDVVHALLLTAVTATLQMKLGNVDYPLVGSVLIGSIPGGVIGASLANQIPAKRLKQMLFIVLIAFGTRMFWEGLLHAQ